MQDFLYLIPVQRSITEHKYIQPEKDLLEYGKIGDKRLVHSFITFTHIYKHWIVLTEDGIVRYTDKVSYDECPNNFI